MDSGIQCIVLHLPINTIILDSDSFSDKLCPNITILDILIFRPAPLLMATLCHSVLQESSQILDS